MAWYGRCQSCSTLFPNFQTYPSEPCTVVTSHSKKCALGKLQPTVHPNPNSTYVESWGHHLFLLNHHVFSFIVRGNPDTWPLMGLSQNVRSPNHCFLMKKISNFGWFVESQKNSRNFLDPHHHLSSLSPNSKNFRLNFSWRSRRHRYELQSAGHLTKKAVEPSSPSLQPPKSWN